MELKVYLVHNGSLTSMECVPTKVITVNSVNWPKIGSFKVYNDYWQVARQRLVEAGIDFTCPGCKAEMVLPRKN